MAKSKPESKDFAMKQKRFTEEQIVTNPKQAQAGVPLSD